MSVTLVVLAVPKCPPSKLVCRKTGLPDVLFACKVAAILPSIQDAPRYKC